MRFETPFSLSLTECLDNMIPSFYLPVSMPDLFRRCVASLSRHSSCRKYLKPHHSIYQEITFWNIHYQHSQILWNKHTILISRSRSLLFNAFCSALCRLLPTMKVIWSARLRRVTVSPGDKTRSHQTVDSRSTCRKPGRQQTIRLQKLVIRGIVNRYYTE
jgi:hypothetical protein